VYIRASFSDRLELVRGHVVRYVTATWKATKQHAAGSVDVYRMSDTDTQRAAHLVYKWYGGYFVDSDDIKARYWAKPNMDLHAFRTNYTKTCTAEDLEVLSRAYPDFMYTINKLAETPTRAEAMRLLLAWKANPKVELLVGAGLDHLKLNKTFARMCRPKQSQILAFIRATPSAKSWTLNKILFVLNKNGTAEEFDTWHTFKHCSCLVPFDLFKRFGTRHALYDLYRDYARMAKNCGHDMRDPYWKYPKHLKAAHDKVSAECDRIEQARRLAAKKAALKRDRELRKKFARVFEKLKDFVVKSSGLVVYVPKDVQNIKTQAEKLHQCLVHAGYIDKMASGQCCLVFIKDRSGKPVATAEIMPNGKIGQFYGDEQGRVIEKMRPSEKCKKAMALWLEKFGRPVKKIMREAA